MTTVKPVPAAKALDSYFLEARSKLLDLAAILDRINRGSESAGVADDPRLEKSGRRWKCCTTRSGDLAERIQEIFWFLLRLRPGRGDSRHRRHLCRPVCRS